MIALSIGCTGNVEDVEVVNDNLIVESYTIEHIEEGESEVFVYGTNEVGGVYLGIEKSHNVNIGDAIKVTYDTLGTRDMYDDLIISYEL